MNCRYQKSIINKYLLLVTYHLEIQVAITGNIKLFNKKFNYTTDI
jgi:hypothetical protein